MENFQMGVVFQLQGTRFVFIYEQHKLEGLHFHDINSTECTVRNILFYSILIVLMLFYYAEQ